MALQNILQSIWKIILEFEIMFSHLYTQQFITDHQKAVLLISYTLLVLHSLMLNKKGK